MRLYLLALILVPLPLLADPPNPTLGSPLTAAQFEAYATGKTLYYAEGGQVWGSEHYMQDHQVMWAFTGKPCEFGQWYQDQDAICFIYEGNPDPNCWHFYMGPQGLVAKFLGGSSLLSEVGQSDQPMDCLGPQIGA